MPPTRSPQDEDAPPTRGLALWSALVLVVVLGIVLAFRNGPQVASLLGTRG
jgi:hypothetical protein